MKKALYVLIAIALLGGVAFGFSQSSWLKGSFGGSLPEPGTIEGSGRDGSSPVWGEIGMGSTGKDTPEDPGTTIDVDPPTGGGGGRTTSSGCDSEYFLEVYIETEDGQALSRVVSEEFTINEFISATASGTDVTSSFDYRDWRGGTYQFRYNGSGTPDDNYNVTVNTDGYESTSLTAFINDSCSDSQVSLLMTLDYNYSLTVQDPSGASVSDATVKSGNDYDTTCSFWSDGSKYLCATPDTDSAIYQVSKHGYVTEEGSFSTSTRITLDYATTLTVTDVSTGKAISNATVMIGSGLDITKCDHVEDGVYWCSYEFYDTNFPNYNVVATGYAASSGNFTSSRLDETSAGVNEAVELSVPVAINPASYCSSISVSSADLPLAHDATEGDDLNVEVVISASSSDYSETVSFTTVGGTLNNYEASASGTSTTIELTWSDSAVGDVFMVTSDVCGSKSLTVTQDAAPVVDAEYELSCNDIDISPDSYEIYSVATSSTLHEFELSWTVIEQLVAVRTAPEWIQRTFAYKHQLNPFIHLADLNTNNDLVFTLATTGNGSLYYESDLNTAHSSLTYNVSSAQSDTVTFYYSGAVAGDSLYISSSDSNCFDSLTLSNQAAATVNDPEVVEEVTVPEVVVVPEITIDFSTIEDTNSCNTYPFTDMDTSNDLAPYINCLAQTGAVQGYGDGSFGPGKYITNAELVKIVVAMTGSPLVSSSTSSDFIDIDGHWAERYIKTAESLDIVRPRENVRFHPDSNATRGYLVLLLARAAGETLWGWDASDIPVSDATTNDGYTYALILAMEATGDVPGVGEEAIVEGYADGTFKGYNPIRRDEASAMLIRAFYAWFL